ncbi:MAG: hypothetical protein ACJASC_000989 [Limimaricola cinnabarinus]|jgi:hypothetical protein|uniref:Uncharacterized protein n=1 Tax=Limimaricola cinnabarinus LL-001 TaxID=1337093 RepID=U2YKC1_9RHOB|nr:hypothetical protein [Limimaricola cinnabarinus]GAD55381.1 hypothetical protein MBELCI_1433 [Limimaricola cinnabarinus LL-001]
MSTSFALALFAAILAALVADHYWFEGQVSLTLGRAGLDLLRWLAVWR